MSVTLILFVHRRLNHSRKTPCHHDCYSKHQRWRKMLTGLLSSLLASLSCDCVYHLPDYNLVTTLWIGIRSIECIMSQLEFLYKDASLRREMTHPTPTTLWILGGQKQTAASSSIFHLYWKYLRPNYKLRSSTLICAHQNNQSKLLLPQARPSVSSRFFLPSW